MAWKQDLAKLKQQLAPEDPARPAAKPLPKPVPKPAGPASLDDEDSVFLSAMGLKPAASRPPVKTPLTPAPTVEAPPPLPPTPETFQEALKDLKGLKPMARSLQGQLDREPQVQVPPLSPVQAQNQAPPPLPPSQAPPQPPAPPILLVPAPAPMPEKAAALVPMVVPGPAPAAGATSTPVRFQLAAGMALEVDGMLDLRGHSVPDAVERLKDRLGDGLVLGWRSLQVVLGPDPKLHEGLLDLLGSGQVPMVARYAQAPVPMGGSQAWLLYFTPSQPQS